MEHTKEPWKVGDYEDSLGYDCMTGGVRVGPVVLDGRDYGQKNCQPITEDQLARLMADASRIAACVNACAGIPTYQLFGANEEANNLGEMIDTLRRQRDQLLEALKGLLEYPSGQYSENDGFDEACERANAAIAAADDVHSV